MRIRFQLRDLFWFTALAAMALDWWLDHRRYEQQVDHYQQQLFYSGVPNDVLQARTR